MEFLYIFLTLKVNDSKKLYYFLLVSCKTLLASPPLPSFRTANSATTFAVASLEKDTETLKNQQNYSYYAMVFFSSPPPGQSNGHKLLFLGGLAQANFREPCESHHYNIKNEKKRNQEQRLTQLRKSTDGEVHLPRIRMTRHLDLPRPLILIHRERVGIEEQFTGPYVDTSDFKAYWHTVKGRL